MVKELTRTLDGVPFTRDAKFVYLLLADYHNAARRTSWPSVVQLASEALMAERHCRRQLRWLEVHGEIRQVSTGVGRGAVCEYLFLRLDVEEKGGQPVPLSGTEKGDTIGPPSAPERGTEGGQKGDWESPLRENPPFNARAKKLTGEPVRTKPCADAPDLRHTEVRNAVTRVQAHLLGYEIWDGAAAKALADLLAAAPNVEADTLVECVVHRALSHKPFSAHPRAWLRSLTDYQLGPLDRYGHPLMGENRRIPELRRIAQGAPAKTAAPEMPASVEVQIPHAVVASTTGMGPMQAWDRVKVRLQQRLNPHTFKTWITPLRAVGREGPVLEVAVPTSEFLMVPRKFESELREAAALSEIPYGRMVFVVREVRV